MAWFSKHAVEWIWCGLLLAILLGAWAFSWAAVRPWFYIVWGGVFILPPLVSIRSPYAGYVVRLKERPYHFWALMLIGVAFIALGCMDAWEFLAPKV